MAKISIIVPIYNTEKYLRRCLTSLLHQTERDIEFLLVDDGSTDKSLNIMEEYQKNDKRFRIIELPKNEGVSIARNTGIEKSTGRYIGFVDSDDYIDNDFYEKLIEVLDGKDIAISIPENATLGYFEAGDKIRFKENNIPLTLGGAYCWQRLYTRELIGDDRFLKYCRFEDVAFTYLMHMKSEAMIVSRNTTYHYCRDNSNCFNNIGRTTPKSVLDLFQVIEFLGEKMENNEKYACYRDQIKDMQLSFTLTMAELIEEFTDSLEERSDLINHLDVLINKKYQDEIAKHYFYSHFDTIFCYQNYALQQNYYSMEKKECETKFIQKIKKKAINQNTNNKL